MKSMELLAPAGSPETLRAVLLAGADAVYVGGGQFGARAYAKNFTEDELLEAIDYTHLHGKKLHLTVNTLLKNRELEEQLYDYLLPYYERGLDAVIVQDAGVFSFFRHHFPGLELHASTQMTITSAEGARFWAQAGANRIVLARELSIDEIRHIHESLDVELECFVHGALCYCYSGQCLFSSMLGGRSGNRGRCAQPCRLPYGVMEEKHVLTKGEAYPLSLRDLCAIDLLPELLAAGVSSLKIEGRMKQTDYAAGVTAVYRKYLDLLETEGERNYAVEESDRQRLFDLGNRSGFTAGYLRGEKGDAMISLHSPKHTGRQSGETITPVEKKRQISGSCVCTPGVPAMLTVTDLLTNCSVSVQAGEVQHAKNAPATPADVEKVLRQTGETNFEFEALDIDLTDHCFIPKQFLKALRRDALRQLTCSLLRGYRREGQALPKEDVTPTYSLKEMKEPDYLHLFVVCDTLEQLGVCAKKDYIETLALQLHSFSADRLQSALEEAAKICRTSTKRLVLAMPSILRSETVDVFEKQWFCIEKMHESGQIDGFLAKNYDSLGFLKRMGVSEKDICLDSSVYTFSDRAGQFFREMGYRSRTLPIELNAGELRRQQRDGSMLIIYGHTAFMVSSQCVNKNFSGCDKVPKQLYLSDRYGKRLPVKNYCGVCYNMIYNPLPTMLFDPVGLSEIKKIQPQTLRMDFTVEDAKTVKAVLASYEQYALGRDAGHLFDRETTRGHFKRGVE